MSRLIRIATRRSRLALWQAGHVAERLRALHPGSEVRLVPIVTAGDRILDRSLAAIGGKGLFIKELEQAMLAGAAELAVHSMKDVPAALPAGFTIAAILERADPRDAFVSDRHGSFADLPPDARVGTSSLRRQCQLLNRRPDLRILPLRGNVETRLARLQSEGLDAIILAAAGLDRLGLGARIRERLATGISLPAVGQAAIGIECRDADAGTAALLAPLDHAPTRSCVEAERAFALRLGGSCQSPVAAFAELQGTTLRLRGLVGAPDGSNVFADSEARPAGAPGDIGIALAERLLAAGAGPLLETLRHGGSP
ncbi:MAG: hydroxymethylbilane synthase [Gammaproteobacteria bacterium]|nr:hydroxymethylbilane synthase [Gammaproteobacteria bacterium]